MAATNLQIADAVADALTAAAGGFGFDFEAVRMHAPSFSDEELAQLRVPVIAGGEYSTELADRTRADRKYTVEIGVSQRVKISDDESIDALHQLVIDDIPELLLGQRLEGYPLAVCTKVEQIIGRDELYKGKFAAAILLTFEAIA